MRDFPLDFHKNAGIAAEAAQCANDQGKYWAYSDLLWEKQAELSEPSFSTVTLKTYAKQLQLDSTAFDSCVDSHKYQAEVAKDAEDGRKVDVSGTPAFFINGIMLSGARPFEDFKNIIEEELKKK